MSPPSAELTCSSAAFKDFYFAPQANFVDAPERQPSKIGLATYIYTLRQHLTALKVHIIEAFLSCAQ
jgi:hypothetical protein